MTNTNESRANNGHRPASEAARSQALPTPGRIPVTERLIAMLREREALGIAKYGRTLETQNGRDALTDALQEALDLNQYLFQWVLELEAAHPARARQTLRRAAVALDGTWALRALAVLPEQTSGNTVTIPRALYNHLVRVARMATEGNG